MGISWLKLIVYRESQHHWVKLLYLWFVEKMGLLFFWTGEINLPRRAWFLVLQIVDTVLPALLQLIVQQLIDNLLALHKDLVYRLLLLFDHH